VLLLLVATLTYSRVHAYEVALADPFPSTSTDGAEELTVSGAEAFGDPDAPDITAFHAPGPWISSAVVRVLDGSDPVKDLVPSDRRVRGPRLDVTWTPGENTTMAVEVSTPKYLQPQVPRAAFLVPWTPTYVSEPYGEPDSPTPHCILVGAESTDTVLSLQGRMGVIEAENIHALPDFADGATYFECPTDPGVYGLDVGDPPTLTVRVEYQYMEMTVSVAPSAHPAFQSQHFLLDENNAKELLASRHPVGPSVGGLSEATFGWSELSDAHVSVTVAPELGAGAMQQVLPSADAETLRGPVLTDRFDHGEMFVLARWRTSDIKDVDGIIQVSLLAAGAGLSIVAEAAINAAGPRRWGVRAVAASGFLAAALLVSGSATRMAFGLLAAAVTLVVLVVLEVDSRYRQSRAGRT
jgi:hypothetical protein